MRFKIWKENAPETTEFTYLRLYDTNGDNSDVYLAACNHMGEKIDGTNILALDNDEKILILLDELNEDLPLKTDIHSQVLCYTSIQVREIKERRARDHFNAAMKEMIKDEVDKKESEVVKH